MLSCQLSLRENTTQLPRERERVKERERRRNRERKRERRREREKAIAPSVVLTNPNEVRENTCFSRIGLLSC